MISVGFRYKHPYDVPVSLYCEDIRKLSEKAVRILAVWEKNYGEGQSWSLLYGKNPEKLQNTSEAGVS